MDKSPKINKLLQRQIRRTIKNSDNISPEVEKLLALVSDSYDHYEKDRSLIERSIQISSDELREINKSLLSQKLELERKNEELQNLTFVIVHDLKEPLRSITSYVQIIKRKLKNTLSDEIEEYMNYAVSGTKRMHELLTDLMNYSTINKKEAYAEEVNLNKLITLIKFDLNYKIIDSDVVFKQDVLPNVRGNKIHLKSLFQNLIENSLKFKKDNQQLEIKICFEKEGDFSKISVIDNGIGTFSENNEKLFKIFKRAHTANEYEGTGIGLSICKKIIENHNGKIWIDDNYIDGFKISFLLPNFV